MKGVFLGGEKTVCQAGVEDIIFNRAELDGRSFRGVPLDPDGKPILGGYKDAVSFGQFPFYIIFAPE